MSHVSRVNFALCWHMHQPWYQRGLDGDYQLPWVYLHAIKDYSDMAAHLEAHPAMKLTVNFAPVLLEQLDDYAQQMQQWLDTGARMRDPLLNLLAGVDAIPQDVIQRRQLLHNCQRANAAKMIDPYPAYRRLVQPLRDLFAAKDKTTHDISFLQYFEPQYFIDILVWYHLAWLGHSLKQTAVSHRLVNKETQFDLDDRRELMELMTDCIAGLIPRYRKLAERGQIELSMTPYGHPIIPLLNDIDNMKCAQPNAPRPDCSTYPGGEARSRWHLQKGIECFERHFGMRPKGVWLSEGAISEDAIALVEEFGFAWTATGEAVWRNSVKLSGHASETAVSKRALFHPYRLNDYSPVIFFRDDGLSDLVGFEYSRRNSVEASEELVQNLVNIADYLGEGAANHVVTIILDGENAWEYYPHNGHYFLDHLYGRLEEHARIRTACFSELTDLSSCLKLEKMCAGSWVYGSFSTWIGQHDKNRAWELLASAKQAYDIVMASGSLDEAASVIATRQLAIAEGSDWFWWFGDINPASSVSDFDKLFRAQLENLYLVLRLPIPDSLKIAVSHGGAADAANAGTMVRNV
jgi:alpha-amylase/alpha-mannosidase (GH57 family)